jgi:nucleotide-binding universal stress UspA family protein
MKEFGKILFPVDLSEVSPKMAPWVLDFAERYEAEIHLLFVARNLEYFSSIYVPVVSISNLEAEIIKGAETKIEEFSNAYFKGYSACKTKVVLGDAAEEILKYAENEKIGLIIIGTHGRKGIDRILFGSVAEKVIKMASVPVMSINPYRVRAGGSETASSED